MTGSEARTLLYRCYEVARALTFACAGRAVLLEWLQELSNALRNPAALATDDELVSEAAAREGDVVLDIARLLDLESVKLLLSEKLDEEAQKETA